MPSRRTATNGTAVTAVATLIAAGANAAGLDTPPELVAALATLLGYVARCIVR